MCVCVGVYVRVYVLITVISYGILCSNGIKICCKTRCGRGYLVPNRGHTATVLGRDEASPIRTILTLYPKVSDNGRGVRSSRSLHWVRDQVV